MPLKEIHPRPLHTLVVAFMLLVFSLLSIVILIVGAIGEAENVRLETDLLKPQPFSFFIFGPGWHYQLHLTPLTSDQIPVQNCSTVLDITGARRCHSPVFVLAALVRKNGAQYITWASWQGVTEINPVDKLHRDGFEILNSQFFLISQEDLQAGTDSHPQIHDLLLDTASALAYWEKATFDREAIPAIAP